MAKANKIELLDENNYQTWKIRIEAVCVKNKNWNHVLGKIPKPLVSATDSKTLEIEKAKLEAWEQTDNEAKSDLILSVSTSQLKHLRSLPDTKTANDIWLKLKEVNGKVGDTAIVSLITELMTKRLVNEDDFDKHLEFYTDAVNNLNEMGEVLSEKVIIAILLISLPESFSSIRSAIRALTSLPKLDDVKKKIREDHASRKADLINTNNNAMFFNPKQRPRPKDRKDPKDKKPDFKVQKKVKCTFCKKNGHHIDDCRFRIKANAEKEKTETPRVHHALNSMMNDEYTGLTRANQHEWILDSGTTAHICGNKDKFISINHNVKQLINLASSATTAAEGVGTVSFDNEDGAYTTLSDTIFVPDLRSNLISVSKITDKGYRIIFDSKAAQIMDKTGKSIIKCNRKGNLYVLSESTVRANAASTKSSLQQWHEKFGHLNEADLKAMAKKNLVNGMNININEKLGPCQTCIMGKQTQTPFPKKSNSRSSKLLELIHTDICGPMRTQSIGGARYFITFIDDKSRWGATYFIAHKSDALKSFQDYKRYAENQTGQKIKAVRSDNGKEYKNLNFNEFLKSNGIKRQLTVDYTPQQNGVAERRNRTLVKMARCKLLQSKLPQSFWGEAIMMANHIRNRCPSKSLNGEIPYTVWHGKPPHVKHFQRFGTKAFALNKDPKRGKFQPKSTECILLGYDTESKAYRLYDPKNRKIIKSRDVKFINENVDIESPTRMEIPNDTNVFDISDLINKPCSLDQIRADSSQEPSTEQMDAEPQLDEPNADEMTTTPIEDLTEQNQQDQIRGRGRPAINRTGKPGRPSKIYKMVTRPATTPDDEFANLTDPELVPKTAKEALNGQHSDEWRKALVTECDALIKNGTWEEVDRPRHRKTIGSRWVLSTKYNADGILEKYKARLVAKGFSQRPGLDFNETFSPVARATSIRMIMALAVKYNLIVHQMDVITAFLNGQLDEDIYMEKPESFDDIFGTSNDKVLHLKKSLYGLKQSGRQWYRKLDEALQKLGLKPIQSDPCIYFKKEKKETTIIGIYVDDLIIASNASSMDNLKSMLKREFEMKDLGPINYCLGIEFKQNLKNNTITMSQQKYVTDVLKRFKMEGCKPITTPLDANSKLRRPETKYEDRSPEVRNYPYQSLVGSLMYLAVSTRPDISYAVSALSQFNTDFDMTHIVAGKRILRYLKSSSNLGLTFKKMEDSLTGFADADWAGDINDRHSHTGYVFKLAGCAVSWAAQKQKTVALSSTEAEYMAISDSAKEAISLRNFLKEMKAPVPGPTTIFNDNQSAEKLAANPVHHNRTKHIDVRYHFVREAQQNGLIQIQYMPTTEMTADVLTKGLFSQKHEKFIRDMGLTPIVVKNRP